MGKDKAKFWSAGESPFTMEAGDRRRGGSSRRRRGHTVAQGRRAAATAWVTEWESPVP